MHCEHKALQVCYSFCVFWPSRLGLDKPHTIALGQVSSSQVWELYSNYSVKRIRIEAPSELKWTRKRTHKVKAKKKIALFSIGPLFGLGLNLVCLKRNNHPENPRFSMWSKSFEFSPLIAFLCEWYWQLRHWGTQHQTENNAKYFVQSAFYSQVNYESIMKK